MEQKQILETATEPQYHDIVCETPEQAETLFIRALELFDAIIPGWEGQVYIEKLGRVLRLPSWFRIQLH